MVLEVKGLENIISKYSKDRNQGVGRDKRYLGTKEIFIYASDPGPTPGPYAYFLTWQVGPDGGEGNVSFKCPHDFDILEKAELIYFPDGDHADTDIDINVSLASVGQAANGRDETNTDGTYSGTAAECTAIDITSMLTSMKKGDYVGINIVNNDAAEGLTMKLMGLRLRYI